MAASSQSKERIYHELGDLAKTGNRRKIAKLFRKFGLMYTDFFCLRLQERSRT